MRNQQLKLTKGHSTKSERIFAEVLKSLRIRFRTKVRIGIYEVDFLIGKHAIEINGHDQNIKKNQYLFEHGYMPVHYNNDSVLNHKQSVIEDITKLIKQNGTSTKY